MNLSAYCEQIAKFALYPDAGKKTPTSLAYCALGLVDEVGELLDATRCAVLSPPSHQDEPSESTSRVEDELGDVLWYVTRLLHEVGLLTGNTYNQAPRIVYTHTVMDVALRTAASITGLAKKSMRTGEPPDLGRLEPMVLSVLGALNAVATKFGTSLAVCAVKNVTKLTRRVQEGTLLSQQR